MRNGVCGSGEYPVPAIHQTAATFLKLWTSDSAPLSSSNSSRVSRLSFEVWVLTGTGVSSSRPDLFIDPLNLQQNVSFYNRLFCSVFQNNSVALWQAGQ